MATQAGAITLLLARWRGGEDAIFEELMPLVYPHLRQVAAAYIRRERNPDLLQATALVHELFIKLLDQNKMVYKDRTHFYVFAAKAMRRILVDHARANKAQMRGGGMEPVPLSDDLPWISVGTDSMLELNLALDELRVVDPNKVQLVELRCFLGCTAEETATLMKVSKATVDREMRFVRSWLYRRLYGENGPEPTEN